MDMKKIKFLIWIMIFSINWVSPGWAANDRVPNYNTSNQAGYAKAAPSSIASKAENPGLKQAKIASQGYQLNKSQGLIARTKISRIAADKKTVNAGRLPTPGGMKEVRAEQGAMAEQTAGGPLPETAQKTVKDIAYAESGKTGK